VFAVGALLVHALNGASRQVLRWDYGTVWHFLRTFDLPYCSLYDQGYTSLGTVADTRPNPALALAGHKASNEGAGYRPAYELEDYSLERAGRDSKKKKTEKQPAPVEASLSFAGVEQAKTAGLVVVGDEVLRGACSDVNTPLLAKALRAHGVSWCG